MPERQHEEPVAHRDGPVACAVGGPGPTARVSRQRGADDDEALHERAARRGCGRRRAGRSCRRRGTSPWRGCGRRRWPGSPSARWHDAGGEQPARAPRTATAAPATVTTRRRPGWRSAARSRSAPTPAAAATALRDATRFARSRPVGPNVRIGRTASAPTATANGMMPRNTQRHPNVSMTQPDDARGEEARQHPAGGEDGEHLRLPLRRERAVHERVGDRLQRRRCRRPAACGRSPPTPSSAPPRRRSGRR